MGGLASKLPALLVLPHGAWERFLLLPLPQVGGFIMVCWRHELQLRGALELSASFWRLHAELGSAQLVSNSPPRVVGSGVGSQQHVVPPANSLEDELSSPWAIVKVSNGNNNSFSQIVGPQMTLVMDAADPQVRGSCVRWHSSSFLLSLLSLCECNCMELRLTLSITAAPKTSNIRGLSPY